RARGTEGIGQRDGRQRDRGEEPGPGERDARRGAPHRQPERVVDVRGGRHGGHLTRYVGRLAPALERPHDRRVRRWPRRDPVLGHAAMAPAVRRIVLAYSGGLDTSVILRWLVERYQAEVVAFCADLGQAEELAGLDQKARATGAVKCIIED